MKQIKYLLLSLCLLFISIVVVNAERITDFSKVGYEIVGISDTDHSSPNLRITGLDIYNDVDAYYNYAVYFDNDDKLPEDLSYDTVFDSDKYDVISLNLFDDEDGWWIEEEFSLNQDLYFTIVEYYCEESEWKFSVVTDPIKVERPSQLPLEHRVDGVFSHDGIVIIDMEPTGYNRKIDYKIGAVTDNNLLLDLKNSKTGAIERLLQYAKNDQNGTVGSVFNDKEDEAVLPNIKLIDGSYYYVYMKYDNENGKYYDVEDIWFTQANAYDDGKWYLFSRYEAEFAWNLGNDEISEVWKNFVQAVKENKTIKDAGDKLTIEYDADSMTITFGENVVEFTYKDGIVSYEVPEDATEAELVEISVYQDIVLQEFLEKFGYDVESSKKYISETKDLTLDKDGIEYTAKEFLYKAEDGKINIKVYTKIKFDLINGLKAFQKVDVDKPIEGPPPTGVAIGASIVLLTIVAGGIGIYFFKNTTKKNKFNRI